MAQEITKIVITGGPCAGKTTAMSWIQNAFTAKGYMVLFVDETATELIGGGAPWKYTRCNRDYQYRLTELMLAKERAFTEIAKTFDAEKVLIVCDRGALDNRAYMNDAEFEAVLKALKGDLISWRDHYDAVFHLVTAANGAAAFYNLDNNTARYETVEEAIALDERLLSSWTGHRYLRVIDNSTGFEDKMRRLEMEVATFLQEDHPYEMERKFLIRYPDIAWLENHPTCTQVEIDQAYLTSDVNEEIRIRRRGENGSPR